MNYLKFKRYIFSTLLKDVNSFIQYQLKTLRKLVNKSYNLIESYKIPNFSKIFKYINYRNYKFNNFRRYNFYKFRSYKFNNFNKIFVSKIFKKFSIYIISFIFFSIIVYLNIPNFFDYEKSILNKTCKNFT